EHFRRLAYARRHFQLLHPLSLYHRSATARGLAAAGLRSLQRQFVAVEPQLVPAASERLALAAGLGPEPRDAADQPGERSIYGLTGLDARGLVWLRHGAPDTRLTKARDPLRSLDLPGVSALDAEAWRYETASVAFTRATASAGLQLGGDYIFTPTTARQAADTRRLLETDRTRLGAPLSPRVWVAFFRGRTPGRTEVYYRRAPARHPSSRRLRIHTGDAGDGRHTGATRARPAADVAGALPCNAGRDGRRAKCQGGVGGGRDHRPLRHACLPRGGFPNWDRPL